MTVAAMRIVETEISWLSPRPLAKYRRAVLYYAAIPLNVVPDKLDAPFVLADFALGGSPDQLPEGFEKVYDSGNGLLLLKRRAK